MVPKGAILEKVLGGLPGPETLAACAEAAPSSLPRGNNSHIHLPPNFSAFDSVAQAVTLAAKQDVQVLGVSNYYDYSIYAEFADRAVCAGVFPLFGTEIIALLDDLAREGIKINDPGNPGKMYLCGKGIAGFAPLSDEAAKRLEVIREKDSARMAAMTARLNRVFADAGFEAGLDAAGVKAGVVRRHGCPPETVYLQERHLAQAFQEALVEKLDPETCRAVLERAFGTAPKADPGDAVALQNDIRSYLMKTGKPAYVPETFVGFDHAYRLVLALGGIPCYPVLADGASPICQFEEDVSQLVAEIKKRGIHCAEFIPIRNEPQTLAAYVRAMRAAGLVVTAGTEHNTCDLLPLPPACKGGAPIEADVAAIFWEGACVVAAHQYLIFHGRPGYVDEEGRLHPGYTTGEARIAAFQALGAAVIAAYLNS